ncbi:hypothetical protein GUJ93_ZPchr0001g30180 [Zizania palustris]|uniref:Uncharacterized protein n=1 Tax=Zizania palustris TaxID=103762 RepID=A0A8J5V2T4_ZIZPA|nr:hypothetical protein GUJ93_ZPchr0001g30180 [Zizania palustris]
MIGELPIIHPLVFALSKRLLFFRFAGTLHHISTVRWGPVPCCKILGRLLLVMPPDSGLSSVGARQLSRLIHSTDPTAHTASCEHLQELSRLIMASKLFRPVVVVVAATVTSLAGVALAADEPAPSPTSGAIAVSSSLVAAMLCPAAALLFGNLRH